MTKVWIIIRIWDTGFDETRTDIYGVYNTEEKAKNIHTTLVNDEDKKFDEFMKEYGDDDYEEYLSTQYYIKEHIVE